MLQKMGEQKRSIRETEQYLGCSLDIPCSSSFIFLWVKSVRMMRGTFGEPG